MSRQSLDLLPSHEFQHNHLPPTGHDRQRLEGGGVGGAVELDRLLGKSVSHVATVDLQNYGVENIMSPRVWRLGYVLLPLPDVPYSS